VELLPLHLQPGDFPRCAKRYHHQKLYYRLAKPGWCGRSDQQGCRPKNETHSRRPQRSRHPRPAIHQILAQSANDAQRRACAMANRGTQHRHLQRVRYLQRRSAIQHHVQYAINKYTNAVMGKYQVVIVGSIK